MPGWQNRSMAQTLSEKVWERHVVHRGDGEPDLLYIDLHLVHEVTSPQAFDGLRLAGRTVRRPDLTVATMDHNVPDRPTSTCRSPTRSRRSRWRCSRRTAPSSASASTRWARPGQGIVHVIGPEHGLTQPGMTIVCGDSHTSTHGAFGALAFGIGTSEVEHVLATQTLPQARPGTMAVTVDGELPAGVTAKDIVLAIINRIGTGGGIGSIIEYRGSAIRALSMEGRMTVCNMSIEAGARAGLVAPDDTTFAYLEGREFAPTGAAWERALDDWRSLVTDDGATFDKEVVLDAADAPAVGHVGHQPRAVGRSSTTSCPSPDSFADADARDSAERALALHGAEGGHADPRDRRRHRVHRVVHQLAHRGPARRGRGRRGPHGARRHAHAGRAGLDAR